MYRLLLLLPSCRSSLLWHRRTVHFLQSGGLQTRLLAKILCGGAQFPRPRRGSLLWHRRTVHFLQSGRLQTRLLAKILCGDAQFPRRHRVSGTGNTPRFLVVLLVFSDDKLLLLGSLRQQSWRWSHIFFWLEELVCCRCFAWSICLTVVDDVTTSR